MKSWCRKAVDDKIAAQRKFVAWWKASVTDKGGGNPTARRSRDGVLSMRAAENLTGMRNQRVSDLGKHLAPGHCHGAADAALPPRALQEAFRGASTLGRSLPSFHEVIKANKSATYVAFHGSVCHSRSLLRVRARAGCCGRARAGCCGVAGAALLDRWSRLFLGWPPVAF
jgi:hypothetical protein